MALPSGDGGVAIEIARRVLPDIAAVVRLVVGVVTLKLLASAERGTRGGSRFFKVDEGGARSELSTDLPVLDGRPRRRVARAADPISGRW